MTAPPEHGKANRAVATVIADALGISEDDVRVVTGQSSARKIVEIDGLPESEIHLRLPRRP